MTRQDIFTLTQSKYNIEKEFNKINTIFETYIVLHTDPLSFNSYQFTIENLVNEKFFLYWKQRGSYFSCQELRNDIGFSLDDYSENNIITTLEYYSNLIYLIDKNIKYKNSIAYQFYKEFYILKQNIDILLDHFNHEKLIIDEEEKVLLIPKNLSARAVAKISSTETSQAILKYNHAALRGNIVEKRNILNNIYLEYETLLDNPIDNYKEFFKKAKQLYNNLHIRHDNRTTKNNKNPKINIDDETLEKWYDELYQLILFCILIKDNLERKSHVDEFLKSIKGAKA